MWQRVVAPAALVIFFWGISSIASTWYIHRLEESQAKMILEDLSTIRSSDDMRYDVRRINRTITGAGRPAEPQTSAEIERLAQEFEQHLQEAVQTSDSSEERDLDQLIAARFKTYRDEVLRQAREPAIPSSEILAETKTRMHLADELTDAARRLGDVNEQSMQDRATRGSQFTSSINAIRYATLIVGLAAGVLCGFLIARRLNRSISRISITLSDAARGMPEDIGRIDVGATRGLPQLQEQVNLVVTRIRQVTQELHAARQSAITGARLAAVGEMAACLAHELRNPLTSIKLLIQIAGQRPERTLSAKQFGVVLEEISRMETTIEQLLDFARPARANRAKHDLREIVGRAMSLIEGRAQQAHVVVTGSMPQEPVEVDADAQQLSQVFNNLLQNGIEAMAEGGSLRVELDPRQSTTGMSRVRISDTGAGISAPLMDRLFDPFVTGKNRGTGLGLAISRRIAEDHGGRLEAANRPEGGAVFTVELPYSVADNQAEVAAAHGDDVEPAPSEFSPPVEHVHAEIAGHR